MDTIVSGAVADTISFDFVKAFDSVPHESLLGKLKSYGINGQVLEWMKAFLSNHRKIVIVNGMKSDPATVLSEILQVSILGPMLFGIYINDLPEVVKCGTYLFTYDTKIFRQISPTLQLKSGINSLEQWSQK